MEDFQSFSKILLAKSLQPPRASLSPARKPFDFIDISGSLSLPKSNLLGDHQYGNISTAIATVKELDQFKINQSDIVTAITKIKTSLGPTSGTSNSSS